MLPQSHFIACNYKIQTFFKPRGETLGRGRQPSPRRGPKTNSTGYGGPC